MEILTQSWHALLAFIGTAPPVLLFVAMAFLPLAGVPISPLWIAAGIRLGVPGAFAMAFSALIVNYTLGFFLSNRWLRRPLSRWLEKRGYRVPHIAGANETLLILSLRLTPGVPLFFQNYMLGLSGVRFSRYLALSIPVQVGYVLAFVWFGNSLSGSAPWRLFLALALFAGAAMGVVFLRRMITPQISKHTTAPLPDHKHEAA
jgi:uncharacterized membrane protein YdjX (TVP38/TMEM64 family)